MDPLHVTELGQGPALLMLHGLFADGRVLLPLAQALASRWRVLLPDLRGHGRSPKTPASLQRRVQDLVDQLDQRELESCALMGYSQGASVALMFALDHPARVQQLVLIAAHAASGLSAVEGVEDALAPWALRLMGPEALMRALLRGQQGELLSAEQRALVTALAGAQSPEVLLREMQEQLRLDLRPRLGELRCPTLLVAGDRDEVVRPHHAEQLAQGIAGARYTLVPGASHLLPVTHTQLLAALMSDFLEREG